MNTERENFLKYWSRGCGPVELKLSNILPELDLFPNKEGVHTIMLGLFDSEGIDSYVLCKIVTAFKNIEQLRINTLHIKDPSDFPVFNLNWIDDLEHLKFLECENINYICEGFKVPPQMINLSLPHFKSEDNSLIDFSDSQNLKVINIYKVENLDFIYNNPNIAYLSLRNPEGIEVTPLEVCSKLITLYLGSTDRKYWFSPHLLGHILKNNSYLINGWFYLNEEMWYVDLVQGLKEHTGYERNYNDWTNGLLHINDELILLILMLKVEN